MVNFFPNEELIRIKGVDCRNWESGSLEVDGRPKWNIDALSNLVNSGIVSSMFSPFYKLVPGEVGCALSHAKAWREILSGDDNCAIVLEDDIQPCGEAVSRKLENCFSMPADADVMFLSGADKKYDFGFGVVKECIRIDSSGRILSGFGTYGYCITKEGARKALAAQFPMILSVARQWWIRAFDSVEMFDGMCQPLPSRGKAYGMRNALVTVSDMDKFSTMTPTGDKSWRVSR